jgi:hypothetical protein
MRRDDHYDEAERLLNTVGRVGTTPEYIPMLLAALTHAVLASVDADVADQTPRFSA